MNKKQSIRRLIATGLMTAFTTASLVTTSYAFVTLNTEATISEFTFDIVDQEGLLLSIDGKNFMQDIDADTIKHAILQNNSATELKNVRLQGVTLGGKNSTDTTYSSGLYKENYSYKIGNEGADIADTRYTFVKDKVDWYDVNSNEITNLKTTNTTIAKLVDDKNDRIGLHSYEAASHDDYIFFDLWLRVARIGDDQSDYKLKFSERTKIEGTAQQTGLYNSLATQTKTYKAGEIIEVNPADAMRLGVNVLGSTDSKLYIYEPNEGLGSYAIEGSTDNKTNPSMNAMYTYYNSLHPMTPFIAGATTGAQFTTLENKLNDNNESVINDNTLAEFKYSSTDKDYNTVKLSVMIWLEGWDADYFVGINNKAIKVKLGFEIEKQTTTQP